MSLRGLRILVTRGDEQAESFSDLIRERGGIPVPIPTVRLVPPEEPAALDGALDRLAGFDWLLLTSANAARFFLERAASRGEGRRLIEQGAVEIVAENGESIKVSDPRGFAKPGVLRVGKHRFLRLE